MLSLILEGGGSRGLFTAGVLDVLLENNIIIKEVYGVSAGACNSMSYASKQKGRAYDTFTKYKDDKRYFGFYPYMKTKSFYGFDFIFGEMAHNLLPFDFDEYYSNDINIHIGVTDVETGMSVFYDKKHLDKDFKLVAASASLPLVSPIVNYDERKYLDGAISEPIPIHRSILDGNQKHIIILTQHHEFRKPEKTDFPLPALKLKFKKYPNFIRAMVERPKKYNEYKEYCHKLQELGKAVVIEPSVPINISRFENDTEKLEEVYKMGLADGKKMLEKIKSFIGFDSVQ